jgi:TRAP transporter TAXI family solute receptor
MAAMLDPENMASRLPTWLRIILLGVLVVIASGAALFGYRHYSQPTTLTVAAGSYDGEAQKIMAAIASRLAKNKASIRLKIIETGTLLEAARTFAAGKVDLAIVRADAGDLSDARTVVLVTQAVVMIIVPPGSSIDSMEDLKGKTVGVLGGEVNRSLVELLTREYDLARTKVQFKDLTFGDAPQALRAKQVSALLVVMPIAEKYLAMVRNLFAGNSKQKPGLIAIESAGAIANVAQAYESYDLPKGTLRGSPPIPDDDLTTLRVPLYLAANKKLSDDIVGELAKTIMDSRGDLLAEIPLLAQIAAPSTDKDAFIPIHPGAAAFFDGTQQTFFEKYSDALYYGPMALGGLASLLAAIWKFVGFGGNARAASPLDPLYALAGRIRAAESESELAAVEEDLDTILKAELTKYTKGNIQAADAAALSLAAHRLEYLINYRRSALARPGAIAAE